MTFSSRLARPSAVADRTEDEAAREEIDRLVRICVMYGQLDRLYGAALAAIGARRTAILDEIGEVKKLIGEL